MNNMQESTSPEAAAKVDDRIKEQLRDKTADIKSNLKDTASELGHSARDMGQNVRDISRLLAEVIGDTLETVRRNAATYYHKGMDRAYGAEKSFEGQVQHRPLLSILIAAFAGILISSLWRRS